MGSHALRRGHAVEDAHGRSGPDAARAPRIARRPQAGLEIGHGSRGGDGRGDVEAGMSRWHILRILVDIRIRDERLGQALGGEHVPDRPGGRKGGTAAEDDGVGSPFRGMSPLEGIGEGVEGTDLLEVEGALAGGAGGNEGGSGAGAAALERRQEGRNGREEPGGEQQEGEDAGVRASGCMVAQAAREGVGEAVRTAAEVVDRPRVLGEGGERERLRCPQQQVPGGGRIGQQAAGKETHRKGKVVPRMRGASGCPDG
jgi:hypothetical protein